MYYEVDHKSSKHEERLKLESASARAPRFLSLQSNVSRATDLTKKT